MIRFVSPVYAQGARPLTDVSSMIVGVFDKIWPFFGIALFGMFFYGGLMWFMSTGDPQKLAKAQATLLWAVVGIVILVLLMWIMGTFEYILGIAPGSIGTITF